MKLSNKDRSMEDGMTVFNKLLAQVQDSAPKSQVVMNNAPTEQDILANLLGNKMKIESQPKQPNFARKYSAYYCLVISRARIYMHL